MLTAKSFLLIALTVLTVLVSITCLSTESNLILNHGMTVQFGCKNESDGEKVPLPKLPPAFSYNIRLNFPLNMKSIEIRHYKDEVGKRESMEFFSQGRHVKYIVHGKQHLLVVFPENDFAMCSVSSSSTIQLLDEDSGTDRILRDILKVSQETGAFKLVDAELDFGLAAKKWEGCFKKPSINVSYSFSERSWVNPGAGTKDKVIPVQMEAQRGSNVVVGIIDSFEASMPADIYFQPPADVYCEGFREDVKPPKIPNFFSYKAETVMFMASDEIAPLILHRSVYFDYPSRIVRIDFHDLSPSVENSIPSAVPKYNRTHKASEVATGSSVIHDFNAKIQYMFTLPTYKCELMDFEVTEGVVEEKNTKDTDMINGTQYFGLDAKRISYNGRFMTRGYLADVYTAAVGHLDGSEGKSIYSWFFTSMATEVVENEKVEKNVLIRMLFHPESGMQRRDRVEQNFYNFDTQEPSAQKFDITNCYDETLSKFYVITFPANNGLRGSENFLRLAFHLALIEYTGLSKQRISVSEVVFNKEFMFAEFKLLESASTLKKKGTKKIKETSLSEAANKVKSAVSDGTFQLSVSTEDGIITIIPLKDGFNEFSGDRKVKDVNSFSQGSVVGLTIGMLLLGFIVGGVALNLIVSRKYGVSLFQSKRGGPGNFNTLNESSM